MLTRTGLMVYLPSFVFVIFCSLATHAHAKPDVLAEFLFWDAMGNQANKAVSSYNDYKRERALWQQKIAEAKNEMEQCGGCTEARAELEKWQGIEDEFQDFAAAAFHATGQPPAVARFLGINMGPLPPLSSFSSAYERGEGLIQTPSWVGEAPDSCRGPAEEFLAKLKAYQHNNRVSYVDDVIAPGGPYYDLAKLYNACRHKNYQAFERELAAQQARANGIVVPDYTTYGTAAVIYYGQVPDDFVPNMPPVEAVREKLAESNINEITFITSKTRPEYLAGSRVKHFHWSEAAPYSNCFDVDGPEHGIAKRVCDDLYEIGAKGFAPVLRCIYPQPGGDFWTRYDASYYWYGERPDKADPRRLLERNREHPVLFIGPPRESCPGNKREASEVYAEYQTQLARLRVAHPEIPEGGQLPETGWIGGTAESAALLAPDSNDVSSKDKETSFFAIHPTWLGPRPVAVAIGSGLTDAEVSMVIEGSEYPVGPRVVSIPVEEAIAYLQNSLVVVMSESQYDELAGSKALEPYVSSGYLNVVEYQRE